ncbi:MAG: NMD3-related protein [Candidatus Methanomethylicia archaeon]
MGRFCVECGVEESVNTPLFNNLCLKCLLETHDLFEVRKKIVVHVCRKCSSIKAGNKWVKADNIVEIHNLMNNILTKNIKSMLGIEIVDISLKPLETYSSVLEVEVRALISNNLISKILRVNIEWIKDICSSCLKRSSRSYEAVVQVRAFNYDDEIKEFKNTLIHAFQDNILEINELNKGYDIKVLNVHTAQQIVDEIRKKWIVKTVRSYEKQYRNREGRRRGKPYISVRIINLKSGNRLIINSKAYIVSSIMNNSITLRNSSGEEKTLKIRELVKLL